MSEPVALLQLVGEQPIPNLLPIRSIRPSDVVFVATSLTARVARNVARLVEGPTLRVSSIDVDPYDVASVEVALRSLVAAQRWHVGSVLFNLTGGTKLMAFAAYGVARSLGFPFVYLQSQGGRSVLWRYEPAPDGYAERTESELGPLITIRDYLEAHGVLDVKPAGAKPAERAIREALEGEVDEVQTNLAFGGNVEVDLAVRVGNQVGVGEVKVGPGHAKQAIGQLVTATEQRYLGTYTKKLLIVGQPLDVNNQTQATAHRIHTLVLPSLAGKGAERRIALSEEDRKEVASQVRRLLES